MMESAIHVPESPSPDKVVLVVERVIGNLGLTVTMRGTLKTYPGSIHWHLKRGQGRGTLEITWWPERRRLWMKIQAGRTAAWINDIAPRFIQKLESRLAALRHSA
jgi:hypothetical protein